MATIKDIAERTGFSAATVSRVEMVALPLPCSSLLRQD